VNLDLIIFDLDGTLVDSIPDIADIYNSRLKMEGYPEYPVENYRDYVGWGLKIALKMVLPEDVPDGEVLRIMNDIADDYAKRPAKLSLVYPGIPDLLEYLGNASIPMIVYTNKPETLAESVVDALFPPGIFDTVLGYTPKFPHKPDPSALNEYLLGRNYPLSSILMAGDTPIDLETACNASISFAGASWGFRSEEILKEAGSELNFPQAVDLHHWLKNKKD